MTFNIRQETPDDRQPVNALVKAAFHNLEYSDQSEHLLVERLRSTPEFIPELSLVAVKDGLIVGHILLTKIYIKSNSRRFESLALAPVCVLPDYQRQGIGTQLITAAHNKARELGYRSVVLIGHETYYPRFGYERSSKYGITFPFEAPEVNCMVKPLFEDALQGVTGEVIYSEAFFQE